MAAIRKKDKDAIDAAIDNADIYELEAQLKRCKRIWTASVLGAGPTNVAAKREAEYIDACRGAAMPGILRSR
jgi:hypothetical protein